MKISMTLPSIYPAALERALKNIRDATRNPYEVIVVSPFKPPAGYGNVIWIEEKPGDARGCNAGHAAGYKAASGDFMMAWVDDHLLADGWDVYAVENYLRREEELNSQVDDAGDWKPFLLGLRHVWPNHVGTLFGIYYPYFPFVRKTYIDKLGWFDVGYQKGFADSDLALRFWTYGGNCEWTDARLITVHLDDGRKEGVVMTDSDMALSVRRWAPIYGKGWDYSHLRGFNNDLTPERPEFAQFVTGHNTIYANDPKFNFKAIVGTGG